MAIIYKKGSKELEYTGIDKAFKTVSDVATKIKSAPSRALDSFERKLKAGDDYKRERNRKMIRRVFGTEENYEKFNQGSK